MKLSGDTSLYPFVRVSLFAFLITGLLGAFLRMQFYSPTPGINYRFFVHAHSHLAFLGWAFNAIFILVTRYFFKDVRKSFNVIFILFQVCVLGMLISFPLQGYGAVSIFFSTAHIVLSYIFIVKGINALKGVLSRAKIFLILAFIYLALSSLGPFFLGICMAKGLSDTIWYKLSIYFYLHFQYNGWFMMAIIAIVIRYLEERGYILSDLSRRVVLYSVGIMVAPAFILSMLWLEPDQIYYWISVCIHLIQFTGIVYFLFHIYKALKSEINAKLFLITFTTAMLSFMSKGILEVFGSLPGLSSMVFNNQNLVIAYLHLTFIGFVSMALLSFYMKEGFIGQSSMGYAGILILLTGFVLSEGLLILPVLNTFLGFGAVPNYYFLVFLSSSLVPLAIPCFFVKGKINFFNMTKKR